MNEKERLEAAEKLVEKTGCTYAQAKEALEESGWNLLDAFLLIEDGKRSVKGERKAEKSNEERKNAAKGVFEKVKDALTLNHLMVINSKGFPVLRLPAWALLILLICWFWAMMGLALIMMLFGCRFHFEGRDFGRPSVNQAMDKVSDTVYNTGCAVKDGIAGSDDQKDAK